MTDQLALDWNNIFDYSEGKLYRKTGKACGYIENTGYVRVKVQGKNYTAHRIIWEMRYGKIPDGLVVDHINRIRTDNRIENLRLLTNSANLANSGARVNSITGIRGVIRRVNKYYAAIYVENQRHWLGSYDTMDEAAAAYKEAQMRLLPHV